MKKTIKTLLIFSLIICVGLSANMGIFADKRVEIINIEYPNVLVEFFDLHEVQLNETTVMSVQDLSEEEAYKFIAGRKNISVNEVKKEERESNKQISKKARETLAEKSSIIQRADEGSIIYRQVYWDDTLANSDGASCKVTSGFMVKIYVYGSFRQVEEIVPNTSFVMASGSGNFTWKEGNKVTYYDKSKAVISAAGVVEGVVSKELKIGFERYGFEISGSETTTCYVRKFHIVEHTYMPY